MALLFAILGVAATMLLIGTIPNLIFDRPRIKRIREHFVSAGCHEIEIKCHYGVHFVKDGRKHYAKCRVI